MRQQPDLNQLKRQAKELLRAFSAQEARATDEVAAHHPGAEAGLFALHDAQLVIARSYGFESWPKLRAFVDRVTVRRLAEAASQNDVARAAGMLRARPELADMAMAYSDERRPLHFAVLARHSGMVELLLRYGANPRAGVYPHRDATSALVLARARGFTEIVERIEVAERSRAELPLEKDSPPAAADVAHEAVASGDTERLTAEHAAGKLENVVHWDCGGLLTAAVQHNQPAVLRLLLSFGFDPDEPVTEGKGDWLAESGGYPLWHCAALGRLEMAELLLRQDANPNVHVDSSGSAVYSAFSHQQREMVDLLLRHGGIVTADTAALYRRTDLVRELLAKDGGTDTPLAEELLRFGASGGEPEIVRLALERITWPRDDPRWFGILTEPLYFWHHIPWLYAGDKTLSRETYLPCFRFILARCGSNVSGSCGRSALHEAAAMRDHVSDEEAVHFAEALLQAGANVTMRDELLGSTPLGWACRWGRVSVARTLLEHGADPVEADAEPWATPRAWAEKRNDQELLELLGS